MGEFRWPPGDYDAEVALVLQRGLGDLLGQQIRKVSVLEATLERKRPYSRKKFGPRKEG